MTAAAPLDAASRSLLDAVLCDGDEARAAARAYLEVTDPQVAPPGQTRLYPLLYKRMSSFGERVPPLMRGTYRQAWTQNQLRFRAAVAALEALDAVAIPALVLKGASLVPAYGGDWGVRDMSDVDLLVPTDRVDSTLAILDEQGWAPAREITPAGVVGRFVARRHSWNFFHREGHNLDLHWRVFSGSLAPHADQAFFDASIPLHLGAVRARRMCDGDLLLHVLEHAGHDEDASRLQWIVDTVQLLRSTDDPEGTAERLAAQARAHRLVVPIRQRLRTVLAVHDDPRVRTVRDHLLRTPLIDPGPPGSRRERIDQHRRGGTSLPAAVGSWTSALVDRSLSRRPTAWTGYVLTGRRPWIERALVAAGGPMTTTPSGAVPAVDADGWWSLEEGPTVDALCGPGWSFPEPGEGTWVEGMEGRLSLPVARSDGEVEIELDLVVLGRFGGPARTVELRSAGRTLAILEAAPDMRRHALRLGPVDVLGGTAELSILVRNPGRPLDLGLGPDARWLGAQVRRIRVLVGGRAPQHDAAPT